MRNVYKKTNYSSTLTITSSKESSSFILLLPSSSSPPSCSSAFLFLSLPVFPSSTVKVLGVETLGELTIGNEAGLFEGVLSRLALVESFNLKREAIFAAAASE